MNNPHIIAAFERGEPIVPLCRRTGVNLQTVLTSLPVRMPEFVISVRHVFDFWPQETALAINEAQLQHDDGVVDRCQGKQSNHFVLYALPRKMRDSTRRKWFTVWGQ